MAKNETTELTLLNKGLILVGHTLGVSTILVVFAIFQIARISNSMSIGTEWATDLTIIGLVVWLKWLAPLYYRLIWAPIKSRFPGAGDDAASEKNWENRAIVNVVHKIGISGLITAAALVQIHGLSNKMSAGGEWTEISAVLAVIGLWVWLKFVSPAFFHYVWAPIKARLPEGIF
jgi:hypothetical protein